MNRDLRQLAGGAAGALLGAEVLLRLVGPGVWTPFISFDGTPVITAPDPELGWVNAPGEYAWGIGERQVSLRIDAQGRRGKGDAPVGLFGGSFVFGYGLSDAEVLGAAHGWRNHAVPGYGTLQSLEAYRRLADPPATVVYGLVGLHDGRNAAAWSWLYALDRSGHDQPWVAAPGAWWDGTELVRGGPQRYVHWPLSEHIALVHLAERLRIAVHDRFLRTKSETTVQLVRAFAREVEADGGTFLVALLHAPEREDFFARRLAEEQITLVDLRHEHFPEWAIPGDGHPDARVHAEWTRRLAEAL